jgi:hypothetical protein
MNRDFELCFIVFCFQNILRTYFDRLFIVIARPIQIAYMIGTVRMSVERGHNQHAYGDGVPHGISKLSHSHIRFELSIFYCKKNRNKNNRIKQATVDSCYSVFGYICFLFLWIYWPIRKYL